MSNNKQLRLMLARIQSLSDLNATLQKDNDSLKVAAHNFCDKHSEDHAEGCCHCVIEKMDDQLVSLKAEVKKLSGRLRRRGRKYEKISKERDRLREVMRKAKSLLDHSIHNEDVFTQDVFDLLKKALNHKEK